MKFAKNGLYATARKIDMSKTGGPIIPKGICVRVLIRRRDGRLWVDPGIVFGKRHLYQHDLEQSIWRKVTKA